MLHKWVPASAGKAKAGMVHSVSGRTRGVQVKLWDPLRMRAIPERLRGVFTTRRYTNPRSPLSYMTEVRETGVSELTCMRNLYLCHADSLQNFLQLIYTVNHKKRNQKKMYKTGHAACVPHHSQGRRRAARASDLRAVRTGPVCCEPRHRRMEASSVGLCRRWRRTYWTLLMIATLK